MFKTVKADKISESISQQIREAVFEDSLRPGDKLPSERELLKTFGVSKASMWEVLRSLEVLGFLEARKGISGGAFVTEIDTKKARELFTNFLHFKNLSLQHLTEVRYILETHTAATAAKTIKSETPKIRGGKCSSIFREWKRISLCSRSKNESAAMCFRWVTGSG